MTRREDIRKVSGLAELMLEHRLGQMRAAAQRLDRSRAQLAAIDREASPADLPAVTAGLVACEYQRWADARRAELNAVLARQTVDVLAARAEAELAFGRLQALRGTVAKMASRRQA